jgi:hypothetical protein
MSKFISITKKFVGKGAIIEVDAKYVVLKIPFRTIKDANAFVKRVKKEDK